MKRLWISLIFIMFSLQSPQGFAGTGNLFQVTGSGTPTTLDIVLCLNGHGPLSCQNYTVTRRTLNILTTASNHTYPAIGIKVKTLGYSLTGCAFIANGFCIFSASNTSPATVIVTPLEAEVTLIAIDPASGAAAGGTGVTLTGTTLTGATGVTFDGMAATSVNVINSTTVTAVTPAHAVGAVDVVVTTPAGNATLTDGYTYAPTAVGQPSGGGIVACLNGGDNDLIAATTDNSASIQWGGLGIVTSATSTTDGATNTATIVGCLTNGDGGCAGGIDISTYAAGICDDYEVDSQGNTPCVAGNACYDNWFLPAGNNLTNTGQLSCLYVNRIAIGGFANSDYWSSTEFSVAPGVFAWIRNFPLGTQSVSGKSDGLPVRCVRAFTP